MRRTLRYLLLFLIMPLLLPIVHGCQTMEGVTGVGADLAVATGAITGKQADSIKKKFQGCQPGLRGIYTGK